MEIAKRSAWNGKQGFVYAHIRPRSAMTACEAVAFFVANDSLNESEDLIRIQLVRDTPKIMYLVSVFPNSPHAYTDLQCLALAYQAAIDCIEELIRGEK